MAAHFSKDYLDFFTELAFNNEKSWFDANRKRYEQSVREPFKQFTIDIINQICEFDESIAQARLEPKDVMFRINRDIRFSKDKTPYNTWLSAAIVPGGKKLSDSSPGYYFRFGLEAFWMGGGLYHPSREKLLSLRRSIVANSDALHAILADKQFKQYWGELQGEEHKVLPKEFKAAALTEPLLRKKTFTFWKELDEQTVLRPDLMEYLVMRFRAAYPLVAWLR